MALRYEFVCSVRSLEVHSISLPHLARCNLVDAPVSNEFREVTVYVVCVHGRHGGFLYQKCGMI